MREAPQTTSEAALLFVPCRQNNPPTLDVFAKTFHVFLSFFLDLSGKSDEDNVVKAP